MAAFWDKVTKTSVCWIWEGAKTTNGYGVSSLRGRSIVAHRRAYLELVGPIPEGMQLDHLCRVRACVNPSHLEPVTPRENARRADLYPVGNIQSSQTHCKRGHEFTPENTYTRRGRHRECRTCKRAACAA